MNKPPLFGDSVRFNPQLCVSTGAANEQFYSGALVDIEDLRCAYCDRLISHGKDCPGCGHPA